MSLAQTLLVVVAETVLYALLLWLLWRGVDWLRDWLEETLPRRAGGVSGQLAQAHLEWLRYASALLSRLTLLAALFLSAGLTFGWVTSVLLAFDSSREIGAQLGSVFGLAARTVGQGIAAAVPGLVVVAVIVLVAQAAVEASNALFRAVSQRQLRLRMIHQETAAATRRLVALGIWAVALVAAYPYLPGSNSDVFKGLSVLVGAMITLGSSGIVNQLMSGLVLVYSRALRVGDHVIIGNDERAVEGVVQEVGTLATKLVTMRNEEITIPNAVLVGNPIKNHSRQSEHNGTLMSIAVSIGYDAPWRQVHELLLEAARRCTGTVPGERGIRAEPAPFVLQRALDDFYVRYELFVYLDRPIERLAILSRLQGHVLDCFGDAGVQIMSPHFVGQPADPVLPPARGADPLRP